MPPEKPHSYAMRRHLARAERERRQARWIVGSVVGIIVIAVGLLAYGWYDLNYLQPGRPAVRVNGDPISYRELGEQIRMAQADLYNQRLQLQQMMGFLAADPQTEAYIQQQMNQIDAQINNTAAMTSKTLSDLIDERLIRQEADRRGLVVSTEDVERAIQEAFGFFPNGTPTPAPTATVDRTLVAQATATSTPAPTSTVTPGPSATPRPTGTPTSTATSGPTPTATSTATPYTREGFDTAYQSYLDDLKKNLDVSEEVLRGRFTSQLYRERLRESIGATVPRELDEVWAKHILVAEEGVAQALLARYRQGESWDALAAAYSTDTSNKDRGGDLGWFAKGTMVDAFEEAAFSAPVGQVVGPIHTEFGWHLILVLGHELRKLDESTYQQAVDTALSQWLSEARKSATLEFDKPLWTPTPSVTPTPETSTPSPTASALSPTLTPTP
ncbi:MAG TPA: peptidylprolyl isomerase [Anaerolineales bacterium]|nr:peptidylprolyl isomerase [Anaerolineales bacterium]